jgi:hypothetical protein
MDGSDEVGPLARAKTYAVPRRYDLTTLFVMSLAYAILFGCIRAAGASPGVFAVVAGFITLIGVCQAVLFRGRRPRLASMIGGLLFLVGSGMVGPLLGGDWRALAACLHPCLIVGSIVLGYAVGSLIGGVFLVADYCRGAVRRIVKSDSSDTP